MATEKNITMKQFNGTDYDTLYPKTKVEQVEGAYSQQQILSDATKGLYGLGADAVPDDAFQMLGGLRAVICVLAEPSASVSMTKGGKTFTATANSEGLAYLYPLEYGVWTVTTGSISKTINIDATAVFYLALSVPKSMSWSQLAVISKMGLASAMFHIGDEKTLTVNGVSYTAVIIGFDHDTPVDTATYGRDKAGITWQLKNCLNTTYHMNSTNTTRGGWESCEMRTSVLNSIFSSLPAELQKAIKAVNKLTSAGSESATINTTSDKLFLLSEVEIFGSTYDSKPGEGSQYAYYKAGNSTVKNVNGSASDWWERSPNGGSTYGGTSFCSVNSNGDKTSKYATYALGVSFGFCI